MIIPRKLLQLPLSPIKTSKTDLPTFKPLSLPDYPSLKPPSPSHQKLRICNQHLAHWHLGLLWYIKDCQWSDPSGSTVARCWAAAVPPHSIHQMLGIYTAIRSPISNLSGVIKCFQSIDTTAKIPALSCLLSYWFAASCGLSDQHPFVFVIVEHSNHFFFTRHLHYKNWSIDWVFNRTTFDRKLSLTPNAKK